MLGKILERLCIFFTKGGGVSRRQVAKVHESVHQFLLAVLKIITHEPIKFFIAKQVSLHVDKTENGVLGSHACRYPLKARREAARVTKCLFRARDQ
jgi:hypothetical protein